MQRRVYLILVFAVIILSCKNTKYQDSVNAVLVSKNGKIELEEYYNGKTSDSLSNVQSLTKGIMSMLIGIAIDQNFIENENVTIERYFPNEFTELTDNRKKDITIKQLLNQTSGLVWEGYLEHEKWLNSKDPNIYVLEKKLENTPGEKYNYNSGATHLLSQIIKKATGKSTLDFANAYLFSPLHIKAIKWEKRNDGNYDGSGLGLNMLPKNLITIGELLLNKGIYQGKQIISKQWIEKLVDKTKKLPTKWGLENSTHGYCWYQAKIDKTIINYGMGYGGQFILVIPSKELVIVTTHNHNTPDGIKQQANFLNNELPRIIKKYDD